MELVVLGAHGTWPLAGGATSGYLLRHDGFALWVDAGTGTLANLQRHVDLFDVGAIVLSHAHPDHFLDLYPYFYARHFHPERPTGLPLYTPPGLFDVAAQLVSEDTAADMRTSFEVREVEPGDWFQAGPFRVRTEEMRHPVPTLGMRIEAGDAALAYTADTGPTDVVRSLAEEADVLLSEATWQGDAEEIGFPPIHLSAAQAGSFAREARAGGLVLTHIWPTFDRERSKEEAERAFGGEATLAHEGMSLEVGS